MKSEVKPLVNLNVNPCKMCMPMGSATAFYGIKNCMTILHGSQGCATYIRRHMATHYNEPIDIASSSLTEQGTVYGGSENLKKGLKNLIDLYHPEVIGVMTTCLAETIGEDVPGIIDTFYEENPEYKHIEIISTTSPGYQGTQYEGYFQAIYSIVSGVKMDIEKNNKINIITSPISPSDTRFLKELVAGFGLEAILVPDLSENLDGGHEEEYDRLPHRGTSLQELKQMAGAKITLELTGFAPKNSAAEYLEEAFGVPMKRVNLPVGLRDTDVFLNVLAEIAGVQIPKKYQAQRGRYIDAMIDSHKYNAAGRAVVFGEPDQVLGIVRLMCESGTLPVACCTGAVCSELEPLLRPELEKLGNMYFVDDVIIKDNADFKDIEQLVEIYHGNLMVGNSDGRRVAEDKKIPLIRRGFPVHDHVGGQRLCMLGYEGSLQLMDEITNALVDTTETTFREDLYNTYYKDTLIDGKKEESAKTLTEKTMSHPCFNCQAHQYARIHLPIAPACNVQCNYCVRKFDCPNESRPGVASNILTPEEALVRYQQVKAKMSNLTVVGIAGPGDALANWKQVKKTLQLIREFDPDVTFCLSTNGLMLPVYAEELLELGVSHITVTLNAVDPHISGQIYKYIEYMGKQYTGDAAGALMVANQLAGIRMLASKDVILKINVVTVRGVNDNHIKEVVETAKSMGCYITNIMQMIPVKGSGFENVEPVSNKEIQVIRKECEEIMPQMYHCQHCRADAVGTLDNDQSIDLKGFAMKSEEKKEANDKTYRFAVASKSGVLVDNHFGHAKEFFIYDYKDGDVRFVEKRKVDQYCQGAEECGEKNKIENIISAIGNCDGVIAMRIGMEPKKKLLRQGIISINTYDRIEDAVKKAAIAM